MMDENKSQFCRFPLPSQAEDKLRGNDVRLFQQAKRFLGLSLALLLIVNASLLAESSFPDLDTPELTLSDKHADRQTTKEKEETTMAVGLGVGAWMLPEESDYRADSVPVAVIFNWKFHFQEGINLQAGYSIASAVLRYQAYKSDWENKLTTRTLYLSYRFLTQLANTTDFYALAGLAYLTADLQINKKSDGSYSEIGTYRDAGFGYIAGTGFYRMIGAFTIGAELNILSRTARFEKIENAIGYSQILVTGHYQF